MYLFERSRNKKHNIEMVVKRGICNAIRFARITELSVFFLYTAENILHKGNLVKDK